MAPSRKHFEAIAKIIRENTKGEYVAKAPLIEELITIFAASNPLFNIGKFRNACEVEDE